MLRCCKFEALQHPEVNACLRHIMSYCISIATMLPSSSDLPALHHCDFSMAWPTNPGPPSLLPTPLTP